MQLRFMMIQLLVCSNVLWVYSFCKLIVIWYVWIIIVQPSFHRFISSSVGLTVVLIDIPFDIMGIKLLWWTWRDDDPNIYDRHYWVPWTSYYFHAAFASSFTLLFFGQRSLLCANGLKFQSAGWDCGLFIHIVNWIL